MNKDIEQVFIEEKKEAAVAVMQEYFPNGGRDFDDIAKLYDAIAEGKVPGIGVSY
ncbi:hypothetical protein [Pantoea eucrina]|uniref:hypothetical protein n=1 Tax=Pantoea eucrina TaxID=472693 RepID=UPI001301CED6|nr:hypothetical protein [Pantoea eucrina]